jgi:hypothetical protein
MDFNWRRHSRLSSRSRKSLERDAPLSQTSD